MYWFIFIIYNLFCSKHFDWSVQLVVIDRKIMCHSSQSCHLKCNLSLNHVFYPSYEQIRISGREMDGLFPLRSGASRQISFHNNQFCIVQQLQPPATCAVKAGCPSLLRRGGQSWEGQGNLGLDTGQRSEGIFQLPDHHITSKQQL